MEEPLFSLERNQRYLIRPYLHDREPVQSGFPFEFLPEAVVRCWTTSEQQRRGAIAENIRIMFDPDSLWHPIL